MTHTNVENFRWSARREEEDTLLIEYKHETFAEWHWRLKDHLSRQNG